MVATTDSGRVTPVGIADLNGHQEIVDLICKHPPVMYPLKLRFFGSLVITAVAAVNIGVGLYIVCGGHADGLDLGFSLTVRFQRRLFLHPSPGISEQQCS